LAFSPLPVLFSKNRRCLFCDTFRQPRLGSGLPAYSTRHAAVWCSDFPPANRKRFTSDHLPSERSISQSRKQESRRGRYLLLRFRESFSRVPVFLIKMSSE